MAATKGNLNHPPAAASVQATRATGRARAVAPRRPRGLGHNSVWMADLYQRDLIYDVGMHNGDDTDFYLARGFRVLAVEADPDLARAGEARFRQAVAEGRLTILNVGISETDGHADFWICDTNREWNSFDRASAARSGSRHHSVSIRTRRFSSILREYGVPHYLKIDIEGKDRQCLEELAAVVPTALPEFVSWENEAEGFEPLEIVHGLGYTRFKLIDQSTYEAVSKRFSLTNFVDAVAWRIIRQFRLARSRHLYSWCSRFTHRGRLEARFGRRFPMGAAGVWGDDLPGRWMTISEARMTWTTANAAHAAKSGSAPNSFWCDWHAAR